MSFLFLALGFDLVFVRWSATAEEVAALDEDFYQRDIPAEYEDVDFDAHEQFDVDDVDLGQNEVDAGGGVCRGRRRRRHG